MDKTNETAQRFYGLDGLRAVMVLLGVVIHSALNYVESPRGWFYHDSANSDLFNYLTLFLHIFRMPIFFVMTGFFTNLLIHKRGTGSMLKNRIQRILLPFVVGWIILFPLMMAGGHYATHHSQPNAFLESIQYLLSGGFLENDPYLTHLWFLYYILLIVPLFLIIEKVRTTLPQKTQQILQRFFKKSATSAWGVVLFSLPISLLMLSMWQISLKAPYSFIPEPDIVAAYLIFFYFGATLYAQRTLLDVFRKRVWTNLFLATLMFVGVVVCIRALNPSTPKEFKNFIMFGGILFCSAAIWFYLYAFTGFCQKYWDKPIQWLRYISDASYWVYMVHIIFTIWVPVSMANLPLPSGLKFLITLSVSTTLSFSSYHLFVRSTWIGKALNGRTYPRKMKSVETTEKAA